MILNTGNRTDIPAFFSEWFYNRIREKYVLVRNPYYYNQVIHYRLEPELVDCIVFCTKNPEPMIDRLEELSKFNQLWFVTINSYGKDVEPNVPDKNRVMDNFKRLSEIVGNKRIIWRYDPIFILGKYTIDYHLNCFEEMSNNLKGYTDQCVISFIDLYKNTLNNFKEIRSMFKDEKEIIANAFSKIARKNNITLRTCMEGTEFEKYGIDSSGCMTRQVIESAIGCSLNIPKNRFKTRSGCNCLLGNDIGVYNSCGHGCIYCYANVDKKLVDVNYRNHDEMSPLLIGKIKEGDEIKFSKQKTYIERQISFLD